MLQAVIRGARLYFDKVYTRLKEMPTWVWVSGLLAMAALSLWRESRYRARGEIQKTRREAKDAFSLSVQQIRERRDRRYEEARIAHAATSQVLDEKEDALLTKAGDTPALADAVNAAFRGEDG